MTIGTGAGAGTDPKTPPLPAPRAALTVVLDVAALVSVGIDGMSARQGRLTFAMARHAVVDLSLVFRTRPQEPKHDRLPQNKLVELRAILTAGGVKLREGEGVDQKLAELRWLYEPYVHALASYFRVSIPPWVAAERHVDNWQASIWERRTAGRQQSDHPERGKGEHF